MYNFFSNDFGFITFCNREDAWHAKEHGNDDPSLPKYNLSFGGRKLFCKAEYADLGKKIYHIICTIMYTKLHKFLSC